MTYYTDYPPETCTDCPFFQYEEESREVFWCRLAEAELPITIRKYRYCPLVKKIRCKDCRNFLENWRCLKWSAFARPEGYCYKAERKKYEKG